MTPELPRAPRSAPFETQSHTSIKVLEEGRGKLLDRRLHGEGHIRTRIAVGHGEDVERVYLRPVVFQHFCATKTIFRNVAQLIVFCMKCSLHYRYGMSAERGRHLRPSARNGAKHKPRRDRSLRRLPPKRHKRLNFQTHDVDVHRIDDHPREFFHLIFDGFFQRFRDRLDGDAVLDEHIYVDEDAVAGRRNTDALSPRVPFPSSSASVSAKRCATVSTIP